MAFIIGFSSAFNFPTGKSTNVSLHLCQSLHQFLRTSVIYISVALCIRWEIIKCQKMKLKATGKDRLHLFFKLCVQWYKEVIFSSISREPGHYRVMFPLLQTMRRAWPSFHLFVLMRKILLIRYVITETLLRMCVSLCIHLVHSMWEGHNLAACVGPNYIIFPSPFSIHWAVRLVLGCGVFLPLEDAR